MGPAGRPKRRALTHEESIVVIVLFMCCALVAGIVVGILDLPRVSIVIVTLVLTAAMVAVVLRGRRARPAAALHDRAMTDAEFTMVMRGYDIAAVNAVVQLAREAVASDDPGVRASAREELRQIAFPLRLRGYDREQVDEYLHRTAAHLR